MWHEARKQERKIRGMLIDYRRRAERRRDFYEKIKADPTQFMQLHGRSYKIHLDASIAATAEAPGAMMPWQGNLDNMIDRFDARAHLDYIPSYTPKDDLDNLIDENSTEERQCNYERYRVLVQNAFLGINEEKFLKQLYLEEQFGYVGDNYESKKKKSQGVAIGFNYEDSDISATSSNTSSLVPKPIEPNFDSSGKLSINEDEPDLEEEELDFDLSIDVSKIDMKQAHDLNKHGQSFGMFDNDFYSYLTNDLEEMENLKMAREEEEERALYSGRRSRKARRERQEKRLLNRTGALSPPSYAAKPLVEKEKSRSTSRSVSPVNDEVITYITSFGGEEENPPKPSYADILKTTNSKKVNTMKKSRSRSGSRRRYTKKRNSRSYSRNRTRRRSRSYSRKHSRINRSKSNSYSRKRRRSKGRASISKSRSLSRSRHREKLKRRSNSRSSYDSKNSRSSSRSSSSSLSLKRVSSKNVERSPSSSNKSTLNFEKNNESNFKQLESKSSFQIKQEPMDTDDKKPLPRYYGRRQEDKSSSELSTDSSDSESTEDNKSNISKFSNAKLTGLYNKAGPTTKNTSLKPQDRLKKKLQILLNKQYKADKKAEQLKNEKLEQEAREREDQMREIYLKMRLNRKRNSYSEDDNSEDSDRLSSISKQSKTRKSRSKSIDSKRAKSRDKRSLSSSSSSSSLSSPRRYSFSRNDRSRYSDKFKDNRRTRYDNDRYNRGYRPRSYSKERRRKTPPKSYRFRRNSHLSKSPSKRYPDKRRSPYSRKASRSPKRYRKSPSTSNRIGRNRSGSSEKKSNEPSIKLVDY